MTGMKRIAKWLSILLAFALLFGCANAGSYVKEKYPLVDVQGKGKDTAKIYAAEGKSVPDVAHELAAQEKPQEISKESQEQMFLVYQDKIINVQQDSENKQNSLIEIDSISYARDHYDSSFLQGYITASLLQSLFGGGWYSGGGHSSDYRGYTSLPQSDRNQAGAKPPSASKASPSTTNRTGSFSSKANAGSAPSGSTGTGTTSTTDSSKKTTQSSDGKPTTGGSGTFTSGTSGITQSGSSSPSSATRKNDGSTPSYKSSSASKPSTSSRSGSFSTKKK